MSRLALCLTFLLGAWTLPTVSRGAPAAAGPAWPQFHGPGRENISRESGLLRRWPEGGPRRLWTAAGLLLPAVAPLSPPLLVQRGYVEEVYFGRDGALAGSMPPGVPVPPRLRARSEAEEALPPTPWPF